MKPCLHLLTVDEDDILDAEFGSTSKRRRSIKTVKVQKSSFNRCAHLYFGTYFFDFFFPFTHSQYNNGRGFTFSYFLFLVGSLLL